MAEFRPKWQFPVWPNGYQWIHAQPIVNKSALPLQPALIPAQTVGKPTAMPVMHEVDSSLFRNFADVQPDEDSILAFADTYGNLCECDIFPIVQFEGAPSVVRGSPLTDWQRQIRDMLRLVNLWDMLQREDRSSLTTHIKWLKHETEGDAVYYSDNAFEGIGEPGPKDAFIASSNRQPELLARFQANPFLLPGWTFLKEELNHHLRDLAKEISFEMVWDKGTDRPVQSAKPQTLLSALWLQLADAVTNNRIFNRCRECRTWFEVAPDVARSHRQFCSNSCRTKSYRERQDRARQMYHANKTFEEIASELDSNVATVKRWITGSWE